MTTCFPHDFPCPFTIPPEDPKPWPPMSACSFSFFVFVKSHASFLSFTCSPGLLSADIRGLGGWGNVKVCESPRGEERGQQSAKQTRPWSLNYEEAPNYGGGQIVVHTGTRLPFCLV